MPDRQSLAGRLILIVDDDRDVLESMNVAFQADGARTMTVADGNDAVDACQRHKPDLVVLDVMLPGRSGFLALEKIKGRADSPMVIMVTANEGKRHKAYAESLGVDRYLFKPVPLQTLLDAAADLIAERDRSAPKA
ncbi:MAG: response regulator [Phycisphaerales bacterium]|nr:response regulator [Phycisphaerales bacterium]